MLSAARMAQMNRLLDEALELDPEGRRRWLEALAAEYEDLKPAFRKALLPDAVAAESKDLATLPKIAAGDPTMPASGLQAGQRVGPYQLVRPLGAGGMAEVWLAQRADGAFKREVALKLPMLWRLRRDLEQRFGHERDILAALEHVNIARFYDAGVTLDGLPYLAMEFVPGEPLAAWCDEHRLGLRERIKLFLQVLDAVQYAHGHQVIHRDLKPSNILVTESGQVRLLDFGVAKLLAEPDEQTQLTQLYGRALTPDYASPELVRGEAVEAASDIYSLGVVLYELLAGRRPYRIQAGGSAAQLERAITEAQIPRPSTQLGPEAGPARGTTQNKLARRLRGDVDAIVLKALSMDPQRRYATAAALADDLQRHLTGEPVEARPDSLRYRAGRFVLRHRAGAATAAAATLGVVLAVALMPSRAPTAAPPDAGASTARVSDRSIAVLPFVDMSEKKDQEYFSDGLSEELIDRLSHSRELMVIARTSSFAFKGKNEDMRSIAAKLGVANLLEGSVRKAGNELRITAQLIRASDGTHLWSQTYDRSLADVFKVQDEIAGTVAAALNVALKAATSAEPGQPNAEAHNLLLQGNFFFDRRTKRDTEKAVDFYKRAIALDPNYALALEKLATANMSQAGNGWISITEGNAKAREELHRALEIDPNLAVAHLDLGFLYEGFDWNWRAAQTEYRRAQELGSSVDRANSNLSWINTVKSGRFDEVISDYRQDLFRDPLDTSVLWRLGLSLFFARRWNEADASWRKLEELNPNYAGGHAWWAMGQVLMGRNIQALATVQRESDEAWRLSASPVVYWSLGRRAESDAALSELEQKYAPGSAYNIAEMHAYRGEVDSAFQWLERAYRQRDGGMEFMRIDPLLSGLRGDSRYKTLLTKMNLAD